MDTHIDELAPIDHLAIEFPDGVVRGSGFDLLLNMVDAGILRLLDVEFLAIGSEGSARAVAVVDVATSDDLDVTAFDGASSGLLDDADLSTIAAEATPGSLVAVIVYENLWVFSLIEGWCAAGARLVSDGGIEVADLLQSLDAAETSRTGGPV